MADNKGEEIFAVAKHLLEADAHVAKYGVALYLKSVAVMTGQNVESLLLSVVEAIDETELNVHKLGTVQ